MYYVLSGSHMTTKITIYRSTIENETWVSVSHMTTKITIYRATIDKETWMSNF